MTELTDEWIEEQVSEFCSYLEGHREALRQIANAAYKQGKRDGAREVADYVLEHKETSLFNKHGNIYIKPSEWEQKKKEWRIE